MLTEKEANELMVKFIDLRTQLQETCDPDIEEAFKRHEQECMAKFKYLVTMKTGRYKSFSNYDDLNQEGFEALIKAMKTFKPNKGNFFSWAHKYIGTRISRSANLHTTIRFPLKVAKLQAPHKETIMPLQVIEERLCPDKEVESIQTVSAIREALSKLTDQQQEIIILAYGFNGDKPMSVNKICRQIGISRLNCLKIIKSSLEIMRDNIKI